MAQTLFFNNQAQKMFKLFRLDLIYKAKKFKSSHIGYLSKSLCLESGKLRDSG